MQTLPLRLSALFAITASVLLVACGDDGARPIDSGMTGDGGMTIDGGGTDAGGRDSGPVVELATCDMPKVAVGEIGTVTVTGSTAGGPEGSRDLGTECGNVDAARWAPQEVVEYQVPGTGSVAVTASLLTSGTDMTYDSLLQFRTECATIPMGGIAPTCFDDANAAGGEFRSEGVATVEGGSSLFIFVTGYAETPVDGYTDRGDYQLDITARTNELPTVTGGEVRVIGERADVLVDGMDADMDPLAFAASFLDAGGATVDLNDDGVGDEDDIVALAFDNLDELADMAAYSGVASVAGLGTVLADASATQAEVRLLDAAFGVGPAMTLMVRVLNEVGLGATCDDTNVCATGLMCTSAVCTAPAEVTTACAGATAIAVTPPTTTTTTGSATGSLAAGTGVLMGSCGPTEGSEALYTVTVPAGSFDLIARTDLDGTMDTDTIVYVRSTCADPLTEVACNDDVGGGVLGSRAEVTDASPGTYTIAVEPYGEGAADQPFELEVGLRPILAAGTACDPAGEMNRCAGMPCDASSMMCP